MADLKAFEDELRKKHFRGYWQAFQGDVYREPVASFEPYLWKGKDLYEAIHRAGEEVGLEASFRRVIQLTHPSLKGSTTHTLTLNLQVLKTVGERPGDPYDGILLQYANPLTGGPTLPTFSCAIQMLRPSEKTSSHRHTSSTIYHVYKGKGATTIDDVRYEWEEGDSFVVPLWRYHRHENSRDRPAILFVMNDKPLMEALGFYREEALP